MAIVLDASAAASMALGAEGALALKELISADEEVFAPDFLMVECANVFWKYVHAGKLGLREAHACYRDAVSLATRYIRQNDLMDEALATAAHLDHPVYDVLYLVLARRMAATLITFDRGLLHLCKQEGVDCIHPLQIA